MKCQNKPCYSKQFGLDNTAVACKQLNRNFIGFEISEDYCKIANKRLAQEVLFK